MQHEQHYQLGLADLLNSDLSCYEYFCSLPEQFRQKIEAQDLRSFEEMQDYVDQLRRSEWA